MEYPKKVMRINELKEMGFPYQMLMRAYREPRQTFAWKMDPLKSNSPIIFDTVGLERWRLQQTKLQGRAV